MFTRKLTFAEIEIPSELTSEVLERRKMAH